MGALTEQIRRTLALTGCFSLTLTTGRQSSAQDSPMLWTTTPSIENRIITAYCGIVVAEVALGGGSIGTSIEVIDGMNLDLSLQTSRFESARTQAMRSLEDQARGLGADAIVGLRFEYVTFGKNGILNMVSAYGTAVRIKLSAEDQQLQLLAELREKADFWVFIDGKERGPFSIEQLSHLVAEGKIPHESSVRSEESGQSIRLSSLLSGHA